MQFVLNSTKNVHNLYHCRKLKQIRFKKGAGIKIHKYLVWGVIFFQVQCKISMSNLSLIFHLWLNKVIVLLVVKTLKFCKVHTMIHFLEWYPTKKASYSLEKVYLQKIYLFESYILVTFYLIFVNKPFIYIYSTFYIVYLEIVKDYQGKFYVEF